MKITNGIMARETATGNAMRHPIVIMVMVMVVVMVMISKLMPWQAVGD